jgi:UDP-N-acetylbacillosamine N-acetyltransferase
LKIYIYGASGHGLVVADIAKVCGYSDIILIDDGDNSYLNFEDIKNNNTTPIALGVGDNRVRETLFNRVIEYGFEVISLVHRGAILGSGVEIGKGVVIMPNVVVNAKAKIGNGVILNSSSIIEHESIIGDFAHISPNVALAGNVKVGKNTQIGIGSSVIQGISIGDFCMVGAGSVVVKDIPSFTLSYGNPCRVIRRIDNE